MNIFIDFFFKRERKGEKQGMGKERFPRERETSIASHALPKWGLNPQPKYVP